MITKYLKRNNPICDYFDSEQVMMTNKQRRTLTELIYEKVQDEDMREQYLNQINDDLSYGEAQDMILELSI